MRPALLIKIVNFNIIMDISSLFDKIPCQSKWHKIIEKKLLENYSLENHIQYMVNSDNVHQCHLPIHDGSECSKYVCRNCIKYHFMIHNLRDHEGKLHKSEYIQYCNKHEFSFETYKNCGICPKCAMKYYWY